ncbi:MAG: PilN domain-containing protein, partial [Gammaproteobacteria bacterium]
MPRINLLPWREELRKNRQQTFNMRLVLAAVIAIVVLLLWWWGLSNAISNQQARNAYLTDQIKLMDNQIAEIKDLQ